MIVLSCDLDQEQLSLVLKGQKELGWSQDSTFEDFKRSNAYYAFISHQAYIGFHMMYDLLEIHSLYVCEKARRQGFGKKLIDEALFFGQQHSVKTALIEVRSKNIAAKTLYELSGFEIIHKRKDYYTKPKDNALVMCRQIDNFERSD